MTNNKKIVVRKLDLASFKSIREFSERINREENRLDVLLHNAGVALSFGRKKSEDGLELTMATNHFGPFLLTLLLIGNGTKVVNETRKQSQRLTYTTFLTGLILLNFQRFLVTLQNFWTVESSRNT